MTAVSLMKVESIAECSLLTCIKRYTTTNVPPDVRLCDTFNLSETTLLSIFSNAMHACIYEHITVRLFPCFIYHLYV